MLKGSQKSFKELYYLYSPAIQSNIRKLIKDENVLNDLLQDVFIALWENRHKIDPHKGVAAWLYTVSYNKSLKYLQKKLKEELLITDSLDLSLFADETEHQPDVDEKLNAIYEAMELLPERKKMAFYEYRIKGKTITEVANAMGISQEAVKGYIKDARKSILAHINSKSTRTASTTIFILWLLYSK
ncbi:MAG: hypothetical protein CFE25_04915 [Chitinophagaceae bacterium BSSC1]|nr:MAG: hypothetical protein CFE25_04915 [Chitinophagaceae bacterium BSSC1]